MVFSMRSKLTMPIFSIQTTITWMHSHNTRWLATLNRSVDINVNKQILKQLNTGDLKLNYVVVSLVGCTVDQFKLPPSLSSCIHIYICNAFSFSHSNCKLQTKNAFIGFCHRTIDWIYYLECKCRFHFTFVQFNASWSLLIALNKKLTVVNKNQTKKRSMFSSLVFTNWFIR